MFLFATFVQLLTLLLQLKSKPIAVVSLGGTVEIVELASEPTSPVWECHARCSSIASRMSYDTSRCPLTICLELWCQVVSEKKEVNHSPEFTFSRKRKSTPRYQLRVSYWRDARRRPEQAQRNYFNLIGYSSYMHASLALSKWQ